MDWKKIKHFKQSEFVCACCGVEHMDEEFMLMLDATRDEAGVPMNVNSGFRCDKHDAEEGGKGNHNTGKAADIATPSSNSRMRYLIVAAAIDVGFRRIGIAKNFIHLDNCGTDEDKPVEVIWLY